MTPLALAVVLLSPAALGAAPCATIDHAHGAWTTLLGAYVEDGLVDYDGMATKRPQLTAYLADLGRACRTDYEAWSAAERVAFWLNAYNAGTVRLILDEMPIDSIRDVGWLPNAAFRRRFIAMEGLERGTMSLDDIEHRTLRIDPELRDPRIHFALVCGARSCPPLRPEAYRGVDLDAQLDDQGRTFVRDVSKNRWDASTRVLSLSSIFTWFRDDFEAAAPSLPEFVARYLAADAVAAVRQGEVTVRFLEYDWSLNSR